MLEFIAEVLHSLDFFIDIDGNSSNTDAVSHIKDSEPKVLATSPSGDESAKPSKKSDSEICKELTDKVLEMHKQASMLTPVTVIEETDSSGRKHVAGAAGGDFPIVGNKIVDGCVSFPAPAPAPGKK